MGPSSYPPKEFNMSIHTDELRTQKLEALITPRELALTTPLSHELGQHILQARQEIEELGTETLHCDEFLLREALGEATDEDHEDGDQWDYHHRDEC